MRGRVVVFDASVLINVLHVDKVEIFARLPATALVAPDQVCAEVTDAAQRASLDESVRRTALRVVPLEAITAVTIYAELQSSLGRAEAACLAFAETYAGTNATTRATMCATTCDCFVASDEKRQFLRTATARLGPGRVLTTPDLFVLAIRAGLLTADEADADKALLERRRFKMPFASFHERLRVCAPAAKPRPEASAVHRANA